EELADDRGRAEDHAGTVGDQPVVVGVRRDVGALVGVGAEVEELRDAQGRERLGPDAHGALDALLLEDGLPLPVAQRHQGAVVLLATQGLLKSLGAATDHATRRTAGLSHVPAVRQKLFFGGHWVASARSSRRRSSSPFSFGVSFSSPSLISTFRSVPVNLN